MIEYEDFSIKIEPLRGDVYPVIVLRSPAGEGRSSFRLPFDPDEIGDILFDLGESVRGSEGARMREAAPGATRTRPQRIGDQLFNALFSGRVRSLLDQSLGMIHERQRGLRIKLHIDPEDSSLAKLASLPWELMYRKETRDFLSLSSATPILRYLDVQRPYMPLPLKPPLRILVVISSPKDYKKLNLEKERGQIEKTWARQEGVAVDFVEEATIIELQDRLAEQCYHVLHYMGHGAFDRHSGQGVLVLEDKERFGAPVDGSTLGILLHDVPTMRLVFLNACETARVSKQVGLDPFAGVAAAMVMAGIPAVVAMQFPISDQAAISFANRFYPLLARGNPVDYAVAQGRRYIRLVEKDTMEWATPVLFMRAPQGVIFEVTEGKEGRPPLPGPPEIPSEVDEELEKRLQRLYIAGLSAYHLDKWDKACSCFEAILNVRPDYPDAADKLAAARWQKRLADLYTQAQAAIKEKDWPAALTKLEELVAEKPDYQDVAALVEFARRQKKLAELYSQAQHLHQAGQWQAVVIVFQKMAALDPEYADPDELLSTAEQELAELKRQAELDALYSHAVLQMDRECWEEARQLLMQVVGKEPGYREAERLLDIADAEIECERQQHAERQHRERIAGFYAEARELADAGQWQPALDKLGQIRDLDPKFPDPEGIGTGARRGLDREQKEAQRRKELAALYAEAVGLLRAKRFKDALDKWAEVQAIDPAYPDSTKVQTKAQKKLVAKDKRVLWPRLPRGAWLAMGAVALVAVVLAILWAGGVIRWPIIVPAPSPTPSPTNILTLTLTPSPTYTGTASPTPSPTYTGTASPTPSPTYAGTASPTPSPTYTDTATPTPSPTYTGTATNTPSPTTSSTPAPTPTSKDGDTRERPTDDMVTVYVGAGEFLMGSSESDVEIFLEQCPDCIPDNFEDEQPQHTVYLDAFWIDQTEVTEAQYERCHADGACIVSNDMGSYDPESHPNLPVIEVTWNDAKAYCEWAGARLPTEAEWEKASRSTDGRWYPWGNNAIDCNKANYRATEAPCVGERTEVASHPSGASPYGVLNMSGNVWEWVSDWYDPSYYAQSPTQDPLGPAGFENRVVRGGSWNQYWKLQRSAERGMRNPFERYPLIGFRCAVSAGE